jgi:hypothetical protein
MLSIPPQHSLDSLLDKLGAQGPEFLSRVGSRVQSYVLGTGKECLAIVEKDANDHGRSRTYHPGIGNYTHVLGSFLRKVPYNRHTLDSALTEPVARIVGECYDEFLKNNSEIISQHFLLQIMGNDLMLEAIVGEALDRGNRSKAVPIMVKSVKCAASKQLGHSVSLHESVGNSAAAGTLGPMLLKMIEMHSQAIVTHVLSSAEFKDATHAAAKNCVYVIPSTAFQNVVRDNLKVEPSTLVYVAIKPLIGAPIWDDIITIARELANKISQGVMVAMDKEFRALNRTNVERVASELFGTDSLSSAVADEISRSCEVMKHFGDKPGEAKWFARFKFMTRARL